MGGINFSKQHGAIWTYLLIYVLTLLVTRKNSNDRASPEVKMEIMEKIA
jgi:hypothetical protein